MSEKAKEGINQLFGGKIRVRVGGILIESGKILLLKHEGVGSNKYLWSPPGGGLEFGTDAEINLKREFLEETGLEIEVNQLLFVNEFINGNIHAVELFFKVKRKGGSLVLGTDPEMKQNQILSDLRFFDQNSLRNEQKNRLHNMFHTINKPEEVLNLTGYFKFVNNSLK
ncbi:NUDIX hydrolase [Marivirga sp. S37H4]|uniref:NUDIX hydrolase n=1 Tax=Marivirga aurantiaca TaxID=2802615 RepID=A0A934WVA2_9BACT|nr:NUDIX hydrolase [Marivirga aurantiaca]MBK6263678.1 NUDIX hydrolase [Marivirga aurantiaca]